jgi:hypothetical protein
MTGKLAFVSPGDSRQHRQNCLSIVVEVDVATIFGADDGPLFAVVGETAMVGSITVRLERFGRPLMKSVVLGAKDFEPSTGISIFAICITRRTHSSWGRHTLARIARG